MKLPSLALAAALLMSTLVSPAVAEISHRVDRFTGEAVSTYKSKFKGRKHKFQTTDDTLIITRQAGSESISYSIIIMTSNGSNRHGGGWRYLREKSIDWLVDGRPIDLPQPSVQRDTGRGYVIESFIQGVAPDQMAELARASSVEFRIGVDEFALAPQDIAAIRELAAKP